MNMLNANHWVLRKPYLLLCGLLLLCFAGPGARAQFGVVDDCQYTSDTEARELWRPMGGSAPVAVVASSPRSSLRMPCNFAKTKIERASWDRAIALDLRACRGIAFQLFCRDASPVSYFSLYLQSGEGWYHATFYPESSTGWNTVALDKSAFGIEGKPAGWGKINAIRVSAWRARDQDTEFWLSDLRLVGVLGRDTLVALVRGESAAQRSPEEARSVSQYADTAARMLQTVGLGSAALSDLDVTLEQLLPAKVVMLPYNPRLPDRAAEVLKQYAQRGGKLLVCYTVPDQLQGVLQVRNGQHLKETRAGYFAAIRPRENELPGAPPLTKQRSWNITTVEPVSSGGRVLAEWLDDKGQPTGLPAVVGSSNGLVMTHVLLPDDADNKRRLLLAMMGLLAPELWPAAARASFESIGGIGGAGNFDEAAALLAPAAARKPRAREALAAARALRERAREQIANRQFPEAMDQARAARQQLTEAWCLAQSPVAGEFRAFWCHSAFGVEGLSWEEAVNRLADHGFNAVLPNMLWGGAAFYPSKLLPVSPEVARRGDQIALCLAAARKRGLQVHVWKVNWNLGSAAPREFVEQMRRAGRLQASSGGREEPWLCPSHPENQKLEIESMLEVARNYAVDGLHFDYIRYPGGEYCFCAGCKERFQRAAKVTLTNWPHQVMAQGPLRQPWLEWRRSHITTVVQAVSERGHALRRNLKISAAVFQNWPTERDSIGQDWKLWCDRRWLDFVCPMDYTSSPRQFDNLIGRQVKWAGRVPCYPGIGESASSSRLGVDEVIEQISITRRHKTRGFVIFNYAAAEANELLPLLGLGTTARQ